MDALPISPPRVDPLIGSGRMASGRVDPIGRRSHEASKRLTGVSVLLVEDSASVRKAVASYLRCDGAHVETVGSGAEALNRLAAVRPDVIVTDFEMPGMTGIEFLQRARILWGDGEPPIPAILCTASGDIRERALASGFSVYLLKPLDGRELVNAIGTCANGKTVVHRSI